MATILSKPLNLARIVEELEKTGFPVFGIDIGRDEVAEHKSFIVYYDKGDIKPTETRNQYKMDFTVMFVSRVDASIDEIEVIENLRLCGLIFDETNHEEGRYLNTDDIAKAVTFKFHQVIRVDR